jgi:hypothetical protein
MIFVATLLGVMFQLALILILGSRVYGAIAMVDKGASTREVVSIGIAPFAFAIFVWVISLLVIEISRSKNLVRNSSATRNFLRVNMGLAFCNLLLFLVIGLHPWFVFVDR